MSPEKEDSTAPSYLGPLFKICRDMSIFGHWSTGTSVTFLPTRSFSFPRTQPCDATQEALALQLVEACKNAGDKKSALFDGSSRRRNRKVRHWLSIRTLKPSSTVGQIADTNQAGERKKKWNPQRPRKGFCFVVLFAVTLLWNTYFGRL